MMRTILTINLKGLIMAWAFKKSLLLLAGVVLLLAAAGPALAEELAVVIGGKALPAADLKQYIERRPAAMADMKAFQAAVESLVDSEVLYQQALALGFDQQPEIRQALRQLLGQKLLEEKVNQPVMSRQISLEEIERYYAEHRDQYQRPEQVRLAGIFVAVPVGGQRAEARQKAEAVLAEAQSAKDRFSFTRLIKEQAEPPAGFRHGDSGFFDRQGQPGKLAPELVEAAFALDQGQISPQIIETAAGFYIIKVTGKRPAFKIELNKVAREIERKIRRQELSDRRQSYLEGLRRAAEIKIDDSKLAEIHRQLQAASRASAKGERNAPPALPGQR